jgi:hypothetical protein
MFGPSNCFQRSQFASSSAGARHLIQSLADRTARSAKQLHGARRARSLSKHVERSLRNLCSAGYTTFTGLLHDRFLRPTGHSSARPPTIVAARLNWGSKHSPSGAGRCAAQELRGGAAAVGWHPDICQPINERTIILHPTAHDQIIGADLLRPQPDFAKHGHSS